MSAQAVIDSPAIAREAAEVLERLGVAPAALQGKLEATSPITGEVIGEVAEADPRQIAAAVGRAQEAFLVWRKVPAPRRGELVRLFGETLREAKADLGRLVTLEVGKTVSEGAGEVQEMIDICDYAVGLSRSFAGQALPSERPEHRLSETWKPLGPIGIITAFNFPVAVLAWNLAIALVCGDPAVWKPSEKAPLCALAVASLFERARRRFGEAPEGLLAVVNGGREVGEALASDPRLPLVSATGSTAMGRALAPQLAARFGRALLELGGNNAAIVCPTADLELASRAIAFSAMGTAGQRCTTLRRLFVHESIAVQLVARLKRIWASVVVGDPRDPKVLVGPLIDESAFGAMAAALEEARGDGAQIFGGERVQGAGSGVYVRPALARMARQSAVVARETFAPILWVMPYADLDEAIEANNAVAQGLASAIFTTDLREAERFVGPEGSDCGIVNVNAGPSGAEIGGAFGGEKETGGGREAGSDSWKAYMRRATSTVNYGSALPLAQGVEFEL